jgi:hypothetical protein
MFATLAVAFLATLAVPGGLDWPAWLLAPVAVCSGGRPVPAGGLAQAAPTSRAHRAGAPCAGLGRAPCRRLPPGRRLPVRSSSASARRCATSPPSPSARAPLVWIWPCRHRRARAADPVHHADPDLDLRLGPARRRGGGLLAAGRGDGQRRAGRSVAFGLAFIAAVLPGFLLLWLKPRAEGAEIAQVPAEARERDDPTRRFALPIAEPTLAFGTEPKRK